MDYQDITLFLNQIILEPRLEDIEAMLDLFDQIGFDVKALCDMFEKEYNLNEVSKEMLEKIREKDQFDLACKKLVHKLIHELNTLLSGPDDVPPAPEDGPEDGLEVADAIESKEDESNALASSNEMRNVLMSQPRLPSVNYDAEYKNALKQYEDYLRKYKGNIHMVAAMLMIIKLRDSNVDYRPILSEMMDYRLFMPTLIKPTNLQELAQLQKEVEKMQSFKPVAIEETGKAITITFQERFYDLDYNKELQTRVWQGSTNNAERIMINMLAEAILDSFWERGQCAYDYEQAKTYVTNNIDMFMFGELDNVMRCLSVEDNQIINDYRSKVTNQSYSYENAYDHSQNQNRAFAYY